MSAKEHRDASAPDSSMECKINAAGRDMNIHDMNVQ